MQSKCGPITGSSDGQTDTQNFPFISTDYKYGMSLSYWCPFVHKFFTCLDINKHKSINATVNIFIFTFSYLFNSIDFDSPGVLVKNKHISQLHSISLLQFKKKKCLLNLLNVSEHAQKKKKKKKKIEVMKYCVIVK